MAYIRNKKRGEKNYYYLVESYREEGKVHQRLLRYIGKNEPSPLEIESIISDKQNKRKK